MRKTEQRRMKIRVLGAGFYGCSIALDLIAAGHEVEVWDKAEDIFTGASGSIPARVHLGAHYPRSRMTRAACQEHSSAFMARYGHMTHGVPVNLYAIASDHSLVDFDQYVRTLRGEFDFIVVDRPSEYGLQNVEGAILCGERHILTADARAYFRHELRDHLRLSYDLLWDGGEFDWTIDATFAANHAAGIDRYEPCVVALLEGPTHCAVTIMDGQFGSLYPWDERAGLCSLSSAKFSPFSKTIRTYGEARQRLDDLSSGDIKAQIDAMIDSMAEHYPAVREFRVADYKLSIRAMPLSGADTRLVDVRQVGERCLRVRAGKIDAVIHAGAEVLRMIG
jgi:FAD dependent oxidoreductase